MNILIIDTSPVRRGAQIFVADLSERWRDLGHEVRKVYLYASNKEDKKVFLQKEDQELGFLSSSFFEKIPTIQPLLLKRLWDIIQKDQPDIILLNGSRTLKYGAALKPFVHKKTVWVSRVIDNPIYWNPKGVTKFYYKHWVIPALDGVAGVSEASLSAMRKHYGFSKSGKVLYRSFDKNKFATAPLRKDARKLLGIADNDEVVLFLGNITPQKRPDRFLDLVESLQKNRPQIKGLLVGGGKDLGLYKDRIKDISCLKYYGYQEDVSPFLSASDLLIMTSETEGMPGVVLEAAIFNVPVVSTNVGGLEECVHHSQSGYLVDSYSLEEFEKYVTLLFNHPERRYEMGEKANQLITNKFSFEKSAEDFLNFFWDLRQNKIHGKK